MDLKDPIMVGLIIIMVIVGIYMCYKAVKK